MTHFQNITELWGQWIVAASWQLAILIFLIGFVALLTRRLSARFRYILWALVLLKVFTPPSLNASWGIANWGAAPAWERIGARFTLPDLSTPLAVPAPTGTQLPVGRPSESETVANLDGKQIAVPDRPDLSQADITGQANQSLRTSAALQSSSSNGPPSTPRSPLPTTFSSLISHHSSFPLFLLWLAGALAFLSLVLYRYFRLTRLLRSACEIEEGPVRVFLEKQALRLGREAAPPLLLSRDVTSPFLFGLFRPRIVLPADLPTTLKPDELENVLLHELIHWHRRDLLIGWAQVVAQALFWFHPFVWLANAQIRHERECSCDENVLAMADAQPQCYGESLLRVLLVARGKSSVSLGFLGIFERNTKLQKRLEDIMSHEIQPRRFGAGSWFFLIAFALIFFPLASSRSAKAEDGQKQDTYKEQPAKPVTTEAYIQNLTEPQRLFLDWTDRSFSSFFDRRDYSTLPEAERSDLENKAIWALDGPHYRDYYYAINSLGQMKSQKAVQPLLKIAADRREKDNRDRWMAIRALGMIGDRSVVPELIHLVYHPNTNTRFWAQISLARLTSKNFGSNWKKWAKWYNTEISPEEVPLERVQWNSNPEYGTDEALRKGDEKMIINIKAKAGQAASPANPGASPSEQSSRPSPQSSLAPPKPYEMPESDRRILTPAQQAYLQWTEQRFADTVSTFRYTDLSSENKTKLSDITQKYLEAAIQAPPGERRDDDYYQSISAVGALQLKSAIQPVLKIATEPIEKDNRDRWMAVRALGLIGDKSVVPDIIPLLYHYNQNTRFWAQITLARLTGQNFGADYEKWREWYNAQSSKPIPAEKIQWAQSPEMQQYADPEKQKGADQQFIERYQSSSRGTPPSVIKMPDLMNPARDVTEAKNILRTMGLQKPQVSEKPSPGTDNGKIIQQSPEPGTMITPQDPITVTVANNLDAASSNGISTSEGTILKYDDNTAEGKRSIGGGGHAIQFERPADTRYLQAVQIFASRYGMSEPPQEDFHVYILNDQRQIISDLKFPYSMVERTEDFRWYKLRTPSVEVPERFLVALSFNPHQTKGIYLGLDQSGSQSHSLVGLPATGFEEMKQGGDWMIRVAMGKEPASTHTSSGPDRKGPGTIHYDSSLRLGTFQSPADSVSTDTVPPQETQFAPVTPPQIISTTPAIGATDVDPNLSGITVTFDRDMRGGFSWTGGGPDIPPVPEGQKILWRDKRTCVYPVKLEEGRYYRVGINSTSHQNFRSVEGAPVRPTAIYFTTRGASEELKARVRKPEIVSIEPVNGDTNVDPNLQELRVTFNTPMGPGFSWCGGGPNFPETREGEKIHWSDDRKTCIFPVTLKPNWEYNLNLNTQSFNNFQSESGVSLKPVGYNFKTKGH